MNFFWRALVAVIVVVGIRWILPSVLHLIGFPMSDDLSIVITGVLAVCALLYIIKGPPLPNPFA